MLQWLMPFDFDASLAICIKLFDASKCFLPLSLFGHLIAYIRSIGSSIVYGTGVQLTLGFHVTNVFGEKKPTSANYKNIKL